MTSAKPPVSVIIMSYNHGQYIGQTISSAPAQTRRNCELIVSDDGSSDDLLKGGTSVGILQDAETYKGAMSNVLELRSRNVKRVDRFAAYEAGFARRMKLVRAKINY